jgi:hypothetical protein
MKTHILYIGLALAALILGPPVQSRLLAQAKEQAATNTKVPKLLKERHATLKELVNATHSAYQVGKASFEELRQAYTQFREAVLEQCASDQERLGVHEEALALAKEYEKAARARYETGQGTKASLLAAKANRLQSEIAFEQAKAKAATAQDPKPAPTGDVKALLKARAEAAQKTHAAAVKSLSQTRRVGDLVIPVGRPEDVYLWSVRWLNAQRDLASKKEGQIDALEDHLRRMQDLQRRVEKLAPGLVTLTEVHSAEFYRVEAELWLAQEKAK